MSKPQIAVAFLFSACALLGQAPSPYVFFVQASTCSQAPSIRTSSGFRLRGTRGVITALHAVIGCGRIGAKSDGAGLILNKPLEIASVDTDHDLALLLSTDLSIAPADGFEAADLSQPLAEPLRIEGHPFGLADLATEIRLHSPPLVF